MLLSVFAFAAVFRLLAGPAIFSPVAAVAVVSGYLDHALSGDSVRLYYGRHHSSDRITAALSPAGDFKVVLNDLKAGIPIMFKYASQQTSLYVSPGDQLWLALDLPRFDKTMRYTVRVANSPTT